MNQAETIALWNRCEDARRQATVDGKNADEAAKAVWNEWATPLLDERRRIEREGRRPRDDSAFSAKTIVDFFRVRFVPTEPLDFTETKILSAIGRAVPEDSLLTTVVRGRPNFGGFLFPGGANFGAAQFCSTTSFMRAQFSEGAMFAGAQFLGLTLFSEAQFSQLAFFSEAEFAGRFVSFITTQFLQYTVFTKAVFSGDVQFRQARFSQGTDFDEARFLARAQFLDAQFLGDANFTSASFASTTGFENASFSRRATFEAIRGERSFSLANAKFGRVPNFIQAHFEEAPRLDDMRVRVRRLLPAPQLGLPYWKRAMSVIIDRAFVAGHEIPARYRALKRLAIQGHDSDRALAFYAGEVRSARFAIDWPLPFAFWRSTAWSGFWHFWLGVGYQIFSDFGRSVFRPVFWWGVTIIIFALYYLGQSPEVVKLRVSRAPHGWFGSITNYANVSFNAWRSSQPCWCGEILESGGSGGPLGLSNFTGLVKPVRDQTSAANEAFQLALRNGFVLLDTGGDSAHRSFGCLYGVEHSGNPVAYVPSAVALASAIQKLFSAVFVFLLGLAIRNLLKMK